MKRNKIFLIVLVVIIVGMFAFGYANVTLFKSFCSAIGIGISPNSEPGEKSDEIVADSTRPLKVLFTTTVNDDLPIIFESEKNSADVFVGQSDKNTYHFVNMSDDTLYFRPVHSVFPAQASKKYTMLECFCFRDMTLLPHEDVTVPLVYYFQPDLDEEVDRVTMHYTLFKRDKDDVDEGLKKDFKVAGGSK